MKKYLTFLIAAVLFLSLTACGKVPDLSAPPDPEAELAACRAAMEEIQSHENIRISVFRDFTVGEEVMNNSTTVDYWRSGEDWFEISQADCDTIINASMYCGGQYFDNFQNFIDSREYDIKWNRASPIPDGTPWIYGFRWENQDVSHLSTAYTDSGRVVTVRFDTPWIVYGIYVSEGYQAQFHFDKKGTLEKVVLDAVYTREEAVRNNGKTGEYREVKDRWIDTFTVVSTDEEKIASRIQKEYESALGQCVELPEDEAYLDACRRILEQLQRHDSYHICVEVEDIAENYRREILRHGDDWLIIQNNRGRSEAVAGDIGYLSCGGQTFSTEAAGLHQEVNDLNWAKVPALPAEPVTYEPWLYSCRWEEQETSLVYQSFGPTGWGAVFVLFKTPYANPEAENAVTENYVVQFSMDPERNLNEAIMRAAYHQPGQKKIDFNKAEVFTILSTDEAEIAARIDREYQRALAQNQ